jgi:hypothetical protein
VDGWAAGKAGLRIAYSNQKGIKANNYLILIVVSVLP